MSTGSQVSVLVPNEAEKRNASSHFFTAASDPATACYKRYTFADEEIIDANTNSFRSLELWQRWRSIQLCSGIGVVPDSVAESLKKIEEEGLRGAAGKETRSAKTFAQAIEQELELLNGIKESQVNKK